MLFFIYQAISEFTAFNVTICNNVAQNPKVFKKNADIYDVKKSKLIRSRKMTDGIGRLSGYGNYGVGGYVPQRRNNDVQKEAQPQEQAATNNQAETQIDPSKVMEFLANNNFFVAPQSTQVATDVEAAEGVDAATQERVAGYMEQFEMIYGIVQEEFGEELAPAVMDMVMDKLMGMAE